MSFIIAGSQALLHSLPLAKRTPKDLDVFLPEGAADPKLNVFEHVEYQYFPKHIYDLFQTSENYLDLKSLYVVKLSHAEYRIHWTKTVNDVALIKKELGIQTYLELDQVYRELFVKLQAHWKVVHADKKRVSLDKPKDMFFTDKVYRKYDHDDIHSYVAYGPTPFYQKILKENQAVMIDKCKFDALTYEDRLRVCREEITVIAIERFVIPNYNFRGYNRYYRLALEKVVTSMTKGWFPLFIIENYPDLIKADPHCFQKMKRFSVDFETGYSNVSAQNKKSFGGTQ